MRPASLAIAVILLLAGCVPRDVVEPIVTRDAVDAVIPDVQVRAGADRHLIVKDGRFGYIDGTGTVVVAPRFADAAPFAEGLARVMEGGLWGYIRPDGNFAIAPRFIDAADFSEGRARVVVEGAGRDLGSRQARYEDRLFRTFITAAGDPILDPDLLDARDFAAADGIALAPIVRAYVRRLIPLGADFLAFLSPSLQTREAWTVIDRAGETVFTVSNADRLLGFSEGMAPFRQRGGFLRPHGRWGYLASTGEIAIDPAFRVAGPFSEGLALVATDRGYGFIDREGTFVIEPRFEHGGPFREGLARVRLDGRWGFVDRAGRLAVEPAYDSATDFSEGLAAVSLDGRAGFVRPDGSVALEFDFDYARPFRNGLAFVRKGDRQGYITPQGEFVWEASSLGSKDE